jgi:RimJ/RimL family protein N-acetyltransferase
MAVSFPESFSTERLTAERLTAEHRAELRRIHGDPDFMRHLGGVRDRAQTDAYLERNLRHWTEHGFGLWMLRDTRGRIAGLGVLRHLAVDGADEVEVGYGFHAEFWGRGFATEIARACLAFAREPLGLRSVVAVTREDNVASQRVLTKLGLSWERRVDLDGMPNLLFRTGESW